jgi:hypothetical protein
MSKHARQQIREAIVDTLSAITEFGGRVYGYRTRPHRTMPDATVRTVNDEVQHELDTLDGLEVHVLTVTVEIRAKEKDGVDDTLDALCLLVEEAMRDDPTFGDLVKQLELVGTSIEIEGETDEKNGLASIEYEVWYRVSADAPDTIVA